MEIVGNCQTHGIDTLYVSAFRATGPSTGDLWVTDSAGDWNSAWGPVRNGGAGIHLQNLITACHAANVRVVAVLKCFADTVQPDHAAHKQYLLDVVDYFVDAWQPNGQPVYDLDGIALDYVRYVGGTNVSTANVTNFVASVRQRIGNLSLHAYLIANRYTFDGPTYNGQFAWSAACISGLASQFGQHWEQLAPYVDVMMPMAYTANGSIYNTYALHQAYMRQTAAYARTACTIAGYPARRVVPTIKTYTGDTETTTDLTIEASITGALLGGGDGYQSFRYPSGQQSELVDEDGAVCGARLQLAGTELQRDCASPNRRRRPDREPRQRPNGGLAAGALRLRRQRRLRHDGLAAERGDHRPQSLPGRLEDDAAGEGCQRPREHDAAPLHRGLGGQPGARVPVHHERWLGAGAIRRRRRRRRQHLPRDRIPVRHRTRLRVAAGFPVGLNQDFVTSAFAANPNGGFLSNGLGVFDANGRATATLTMPPLLLQPFVWQSVHWNFLSMDLFGQPRCVGDSKPLLLTFLTAPGGARAAPTSLRA